MALFYLLYNTSFRQSFCKNFTCEKQSSCPEQFKNPDSCRNMVNLNIPPKYLAVYAQCIDDSLPAFQPDEWIENGRIYPVKYFTEPLNTQEGFAVTILDADGEEIHPSASHWSFASHRFEILTFFLN